ncbi:hypothetical protein [Lacisediminihabitans sp.]|jgi:hypothetical protein|uniref:hypothetical protein n=1 Tax=Lacisediminihabitans sp. TaxID=2787631 RepID=UPI002F9416AE
MSDQQSSLPSLSADEPVADDVDAPRGTNRLASAALYLGIAGAALSLIPVAGPFLCWLPALLAVIFGFLSLRTSRNLGGLRHTEALWGTLLGFAPIPITALWLAFGVALGAITDRPIGH